MRKEPSTNNGAAPSRRGRRALPKRSEHHEQAGFFARAMAYSREYPALELLYAVPNGEKRDKRVKQLRDGRYVSYSPTGRKLAAEGVRSGVPDMCLPYAADGYFGLYIEMKRADGVESEKQEWWRKRLEANNYKSVVCYSADEAFAVIMEYVKSEPTINQFEFPF